MSFFELREQIIHECKVAVYQKICDELNDSGLFGWNMWVLK